MSPNCYLVRSNCDGAMLTRLHVTGASKLGRLKCGITILTVRKVLTYLVRS